MLMATLPVTLVTLSPLRLPARWRGQRSGPIKTVEDKNCRGVTASPTLRRRLRSKTTLSLSDPDQEALPCSKINISYQLPCPLPPRCCVGSQLVDWMIQECSLVHSRQQGVGMWQVLLEEGILKHGKSTHTI